MSNGTATASTIDTFRAVVRQRPDSTTELPDVRDFAVDAMLPDIAISVRDEDDVALVLREARDARLSVVAFGGGCHVGAGNVPESYDVALSLAAMDGVVAYEPEDLTITLQPGVRLAELRLLLDQHRQLLPLDPPAGDAATIGGVLAANVSGPLRHAYGTSRDWVIGMRVVGSDGVATKSGGRVVKNVAGYDMAKLHIGALGTLGVITEVTLKLAPAPPVSKTLAVTCDTAHSAALVAFAAHDAGLALQALELLSPPAAYAVLGESRWSLLARAGGAPAAVDRTSAELAALAAGLAGNLTEARENAWRAWAAAFAPSELSLRISVLPADVAEIVEVLDRRFTGAAAMLSATVSAGLIRANVDAQRLRPLTIIEHAREAAMRRGGAMFIDAAPPLVKRQHDVFGQPRSDVALMRRLKEQFDPTRTLAPGRHYGRI